MIFIGKKNRPREKKKKILLLNIFVPVMIFSLLGGFSAIMPGCTQDPKKGQADLVFWNVYDDSDVFAYLIKKFNKDYPKIKITYYKKPYVDYEADLVNDLAAGRGPDIFAIHNTWLPKHMDKIAPMGAGSIVEATMTTKDFRDTFVDVAAQDFIIQQLDRNGRVASESIYGIPLYVDTLALYWNKDLLNSQDIKQPPKDWHEFNADVEQLTKKDESGNVLLAGASLGTAKNINRATDILTLLMLQTGTQMVDLTKMEATFNQPVKVDNSSLNVGLSSLDFYTNFANPGKKSYTWNDQMGYSIDAFAEGKSAMMISYAYNMKTVKDKQPHLSFGIAPVPQPKDATVEVNFANYWGLSVSAKADANKQKYAWIFIKWLSEQTQDKDYTYMTERPTSRRDLIGNQGSSDLDIFANQALSARSWYEADNLAIDAIFANMIEAVNKGQETSSQALSQAASAVTVLMAKKASQ